MAQCLAILAPSGRDASVIQGILKSAGVKSVQEKSVAGVLKAIDDVRAGAAILAEEALGDDGIEVIEQWLDTQPPWSDLPIFNSAVGHKRIFVESGGVDVLRGLPREDGNVY